MSRGRAITTISHELIHLLQTEEGRMINGKDTLWFEGIPYTKNSVMNYTNRPWELEAYKRQYWLQDRINEVLYSKEK